VRSDEIHSRKRKKRKKKKKKRKKRKREKKKKKGKKKGLTRARTGDLIGVNDVS